MKQREIKFRAMSEGKMEPISGYGSASGGVFELDRKFDSPLMQFTGLKDKNGKEIYEGDVVKYEILDDVFKHHGDTRIREVKWDERAGHYFLLGPLPGDHNPYRELYDFNSRAEIIGNIYENPELLTT